MTFRVGILGIDGSGKSTLVAGLEQRLAASCSVMSIGQRVTFRARGGERLDILGPLPETAHPLQHSFRNLQRHWMLQRLPGLLKQYRPDICLEDRDSVIDCCALTTAHLPALRSITPRRRVATFLTLTRRSQADMYLYLGLPAAVADKRIQGKLR
jgi:ABC-type cobalamin/Fe3+-siderophores transport system ATPase subunit